MFRKIIGLFFAMSILVALTISGCTYANPTNTNPTENSSETEDLLPKGYTIEKIKYAFEEYINYRLYLYPAEIMEGKSDKDFDDYIGISIDAEIRIYNNESVNRIRDLSVYIHTNIGEWLAFFKINRGIVYCDGQTSEGGTAWPVEPDNYKVVERYSLKIAEPRKPNYGMSEQKKNLIDAIQEDIMDACESFYKDTLKPEWKNVDVYIADFFEYENGAHAWLCRKDGLIINYPVHFDEMKGEIILIPGKGFTMSSIDQFNEFGRYQFEKDIQDAVRHFVCNQDQG
ncbi:MAG: hypothetical protein GXX10_03515 [Clostridiaceae bacterium]|nr:hypothetical protein [Clostridiaceae bacterium]